MKRRTKAVLFLAGTYGLLLLLMAIVFGLAIVVGEGGVRDVRMSPVQLLGWGLAAGLFWTGIPAGVHSLLLWTVLPATDSKRRARTVAIGSGIAVFLSMTPLAVLATPSLGPVALGLMGGLWGAVVYTPANWRAVKWEGPSRENRVNGG